MFNDIQTYNNYDWFVSKPINIYIYILYYIYTYHTYPYTFFASPASCRTLATSPMFHVWSSEANSTWIQWGLGTGFNETPMVCATRFWQLLAASASSIADLLNPLWIGNRRNRICWRQRRKQQPSLEQEEGLFLRFPYWKTLLILLGSSWCKSNPWIPSHQGRVHLAPARQWGTSYSALFDSGPTAHVQSHERRSKRRATRKRRRPSNPTLQILQWLPKIIHSHELEGSDTVIEDDQNCGFVVPPFLNHKKLDRTCRSPSMLFSSLGSPAKLVQFQSPKRLGHQKRQEVVLSSTNDLENIRPTKAIALPALPVAHPRGQHFWQRKHTLDMSLHWQFSSPLLADDLYWGLYSIVGMRGFCAKSCVWKSEAAMIAGCCNGCSLWGIHPKTARLGAAEIPHTA